MVKLGLWVNLKNAKTMRKMTLNFSVFPTFTVVGIDNCKKHSANAHWMARFQADHSRPVSDRKVPNPSQWEWQSEGSMECHHWNNNVARQNA